MKILSAEQTRQTDAHTIQYEPIASIDLMERASRAFTDWFTETFEKDQKIHVVCGTGNNGGDGLAVSRLLLDNGYKVTPFVIRVSEGNSEDFGINFDRLSEKTEIIEIRSEEELQQLDQPDIFIDAIFGSGLTRPVEGLFASVINYIRNSQARVVAIDIASGLFCDQHSPGPTMRVDHTVSFQMPKLAFMMPENDLNVGHWHVVDIGLDPEFIEAQETHHILVERQEVAGLLNERRRHAHKGTFGRALLMTGSYGKMGAGLLSGRACLRAGVGLLTIHVPACGYSILQTALPEAMVSVDKGEQFIKGIPADLDRYSAIGIGPGIDTGSDTVKSMRNLLSNVTNPLVIDADALNILSENRELIHSVPAHSILTPHPLEYERLIGESLNDFEKIERAREFCVENQVLLVLKGANTAIVNTQGRVFFNSTGNPGMATGGSGDVLTGILTGLLAQDYSSLHAAMLGVYLHGLAGDLAAKVKGQHSLIASDIIEHLPDAFLTVR